MRGAVSGAAAVPDATAVPDAGAGAAVVSCAAEVVTGSALAEEAAFVAAVAPVAIDAFPPLLQAAATNAGATSHTRGFER